MKKILGISLVALMAVAPSLANAAGERSVSLTKLNASDPVATANLATTSYVGGAYKTTADKIDLLIDDTAVTTDGTYIKAGKSVSANLTALDGQVKSTSDMILDPVNGLAKIVNDDHTAIETLTGDGEGSVAAQIEAALEDYDGTSASVGDLDDLNTTNKDSVVGAINEVDSAVGDLDGLNTTDKDSIVDAINEVNSAVGAVDSAVDTLENKTITYVESWATPTPVTKKLSQLPDFGS